MLPIMRLHSELCGCMILLRVGFCEYYYEPLKIFCNNSVAISLSQNITNSSRTKHIDIKYLFVREKVPTSHICVENIPTKHVLADPLTKGLAPKMFQEHVTNMSFFESSIIFSWWEFHMYVQL